MDQATATATTVNAGIRRLAGEPLLPDSNVDDFMVTPSKKWPRAIEPTYSDLAHAQFLKKCGRWGLILRIRAGTPCEITAWIAVASNLAYICEIATTALNPVVTSNRIGNSRSVTFQGMPGVDP
jgi:hypothetical protein